MENKLMIRPATVNDVLAVERLYAQSVAYLRTLLVMALPVSPRETGSPEVLAATIVSPTPAQEVSHGMIRVSPGTVT